MNTAQISFLGEEVSVDIQKKKAKKEDLMKKTLEDKDNEINELKEAIKKLEEGREEFIRIDFLNVDNHSHCSQESFRLTYRQLETVVEMCVDYAEILDSKKKEIENNPYKLATYNFKAKQIREIGNKIAGEIKYNKSCNSKKNKKSDIGGDALELLVNGYER